MCKILTLSPAAGGSMATLPLSALASSWCPAAAASRPKLTPLCNKSNGLRAHKRIEKRPENKERLMRKQRNSTCSRESSRSFSIAETSPLLTCEFKETGTWAVTIKKSYKLIENGAYDLPPVLRARGQQKCAPHWLLSECVGKRRKVSSGKRSAWKTVNCILFAICCALWLCYKHYSYLLASKVHRCSGLYGVELHVQRDQRKKSKYLKHRDGGTWASIVIFSSTSVCILLVCAMMRPTHVDCAWRYVFSLSLFWLYMKHKAHWNNDICKVASVYNYRKFLKYCTLRIM